MKTINLLILSLLLASSAEAVVIRERQAMAERTISEALKEVKTHKKKHHHHHHSETESESDEDVQENDKKTPEAKKALSEHQGLVQQTIDAVNQSQGSPEEDAKMREFIKNMNRKSQSIETPTTYEYRIKQGIKDRPDVATEEVKHIENQAEAEAKATLGGDSMKQEQIKPVGGKDQLPNYEEKNTKTLVDAHNESQDMNGKSKYADLLAKTEAKPEAAKDAATPPAAPAAPAAPEQSLIQKKETTPVPVVADKPAAEQKKETPATATPAAPVSPAKPVEQKIETPVATSVVAPVAAPVVAPVAAPVTEAPKAAPVQVGFSQMEKEFENTLQEVLSLHESSVDLLTADSAFHKLSHLSDPETDYRTLDKTMTEMAYLDILDKFEVTMSDDEEKSFYKNHFEPAWKKYSDGAIMDYNKTPGFFQELKQKIVM